MALYYWVGGYTGYQGMHSGYSGNNVWTNWQTGTTSSAGDFLSVPIHGVLPQTGEYQFIVLLGKFFMIPQRNCHRVEEIQLCSKDSWN